MEAFVDNYVSEKMEQAHVPGLAIAVVHQGELVLAKGYGYADLDTRQPMTAQTNLRVGSVSKPVTSAAVLQLVERGFVSKAQVDQLTATRDAARARVAVARAQYNELLARN